jgi:hypothetical protein
MAPPVEAKMIFQPTGRGLKGLKNPDILPYQGSLTETPRSSGRRGVPDLAASGK